MSTPASFVQRGQLAQDARQCFVEAAGQHMAGLAVAVQERLRSLLDEAASAPEIQTRRDVWTAYLSRRAAWYEGVVTAWQAALTPSPKQDLPAGLTLLGTDAVDKQIIASRLAQVLMESVSTELNDLLLRLKHLANPPEAAGPEILQPDVLVWIMVEQWTLVGMPLEAWSKVSDLVCQFLLAGLPQAYHKANALLIQQGVLPTIEVAYRVSRAPAAPPSSPPLPSPPPRRDEGVAARVPPLAAAGTVTVAAEDPPLMSSQVPLTRARGRAQEVLGQLKRLLRGVADVGADAAHHPSPSPALSAAMAVRPPLGGAWAGRGSDAITADYRAGGLAKVASELLQHSTVLKNQATSQSEKATIEIVALMFQSILQEDRIPTGIRVWFARLQMPVLRVALAEPDFFGTLNHPARQLIDRMGSCVMGFDASGIDGGALETEIKRVVQMIEQYPETGKQVYQLVYTEFQDFLAQFLTGQTVTKKLVSVAQQVEEKETLTIQYTIEMRNMLKDMPVREEVREFLFKVWAEVLAVAAVRKGPQHDDTLGFKKAASDLVWAASAKPSRHDRARVIQDLPPLLQKLRVGMSLLGLAPSVQETHLKQVSDTLADAFLSKTQAIPAEQIAAMAARLAHLEDFVSDDGMADLPLDAQGIEMMLGLEAATIDVVTGGGSTPSVAMQAWAQELELGSWFTLDHNAQEALVQFVWRSERKQLHLFSATDGHSYLIQSGRLAAYLQAGLLFPQEEDTLTVRATRDALGKLQANPQRLLD